MNRQSIQLSTRSGPRDQTLPAYKAWVEDIAKRLTTMESNLKLTEKEWITFWREFWKEKNRRGGTAGFRDR